VSLRIVLASGSPRRREILGLLGVEFDVVPADIDESVRPGEDPRAYVRRLGIEKARALPFADALVIAADTTVDVDGEILGKPVDHDEARRMLRLISDRSHFVHTGVAVRLGEHCVDEVVTSHVHVRAITEADIDWYLATGEPFDKAGAYALQGAAGVFVTGISGSVSSIVGLPMDTVDRLAAALGCQLRR
jgi:septum formation protein